MGTERFSNGYGKTAKKKGRAAGVGLLFQNFIKGLRVRSPLFETRASVGPCCQQRMFPEAGCFRFRAGNSVWRERKAMRLIDAHGLCEMLGYDKQEVKITDDASGKPGKRVYPAGLQRAWEIAREPEKVGLPKEAIVRIGKNIRFRLDLIEKWIAGGGTQRRVAR